MKKCYAKVLGLTTFLFLFAAGSTSFAQNLLENGDFETWDAGSPTGWDIQKDGISVAQEGTIVHGGSSSAAVTLTGNKATTDFGQSMQFITDSGATYIFSVWAYHTEGTNFFAWVVGKPGAYNFSSSSGIHTDNTIVNDWQEFTWQWTSFTTDTVDVFFRSYNQAGFDGEEVMYLDDATITEIPPAVELLENPGFETWENDSAVGWDIIKDGISVAQESSIVHGGSYSAAVTITGNKATTDFGQEMNVIVDSGMTYTLSVWAYHTEGTNFFAWVIGKPGGYTFSSSSGIHTDNTILNEWQEFTWSWPCYKTDTVDVFFRSYNQEGFDGEEVMYLDDASVMIQAGPVVSTDATLKELKVEGVAIDTFNAGHKFYTVYLPSDFDQVPTVDATPTDENATYEVIPATDIMSADSADRVTDVVVTAEDGTTIVTYHVYFVRVAPEGLNAPVADAVKVYPVPARDYVILSRANDHPEILTIRNLTGRVVKAIFSSERETRIDVCDLHPGFYFISTEGHTLKFIKR
jgi:hypothetical protein